MSTDPKHSGGRNEGIQATNVSAGVVAVGRGAQATSYVVQSTAQPSELTFQISKVEQVLAQLIEDKQQLAKLREELVTLRALTADTRQERVDGAAAKAEASSVLERFTTKLKMTNVVLSDVATLVTPLVTIAKALSVPLHLLGLG